MTVGAFFIEIEETIIPIVKIDKDLEFKETMFIEVDTNKRLAQMYAQHGIREKTLLRLENLEYHSENITALKASKGIYSKDTLYFKGNVYIENADGYSYSTEEANYNQKEEILYVTAPFIAEQGQNEFQGNSLEYNVKEKELYSTEVHAVFYTESK